MSCEEIITQNGINDKTIWGKIYWKFIILNIFNMNDDSEGGIISMLTSIGRMIPCEECKKHFIEHLEEFSCKPEISTLTKDVAIDFIVSLFNKIESDNGRPTQFTWYSLVKYYIGEEFDKACLICKGE